MTVDNRKFSVGIIGLGAMGGSMAARLIECDQSVVGYDSLPEVRDRAEKLGVRIADGVAQIASRASVIVLSLPKASHVDKVMATLAESMGPGGVIVDTTTSEPATSRRHAAAGIARGFSFLDAPVSGGPAGARAGTMTMIVGGDESGLTIARPMLEFLTSQLLHIGDSGAGNVAKIANNLLCAANLALLGEMVKLGNSADVAPDALISAINAGSGRSGVSEVNYPRWILNEAFDSGFTMGLMRKDVGLAEQLAGEHQLDLPAMQAIADIWKGSVDELSDGADFNEITRYKKV